MLRKLLIYPFLVFLGVLLIATVFVFMSDKDTRHSNIRVENVTIRLPAPGQTTAAAYFDIINDGGINQLLSASTPISDRVELHTHLHEDGIMKMRKVESVKVLPKQTTQFKRMGLHVMIFNVQIPEGTTEIPLTLTFAREAVHVQRDRKVKDERTDEQKQIDELAALNVNVIARITD